MNISSYLDSSSRRPSPESIKKANGEQFQDTEVKENEKDREISIVPKGVGVSMFGHAKLKKAMSKTLPSKGAFENNLDDSGYPIPNRNGFNLDSIEENPLLKRDSISPESQSRRSTFKPDLIEDSNIEIEVETPNDQKNEKESEINDPQTQKTEKYPAQRKALEMPADKIQRQRQHIKDDFLAENLDKYTVESDHPRDDKPKKKSKIPPRRIQSILKKSKTNKRSVGNDSPENKKVQFNRYKQVLTFHKEKGI